jgi:hypothetical protein
MGARWTQAELDLFPLMWSRRDVLLQAASMTVVHIEDAVETILALWSVEVAAGAMSSASFLRYAGLVQQFAAYSKRKGCVTLDDAVDYYDTWLLAYGHDRRGRACAPTVSVQHVRSCAVRACFATGRLLGVATAVPAYVGHGSGGWGSGGRPLNDVEATDLRSTAYGQRGTRRGVAAAVALSGAGTADAGNMTPHHVDLQDNVLWLPGSHTIPARKVAIPGQWEYDMLKWRLKDLARWGGSGAKGLVVSRTGTPANHQAGASTALSEMLSMARIHDPDVRPASIQRYAALVYFESSANPADAMRLLGVSSLDAAARAIGWDFNTQDPVRVPLRAEYQPRVIR